MIIYSQETDDGLADKISASTTISYASIVEPSEVEQNQIKTKTLAAVEDFLNNPREWSKAHGGV